MLSGLTRLTMRLVIVLLALAGLWMALCPPSPPRRAVLPVATEASPFQLVLHLDNPNIMQDEGISGHVILRNTGATDAKLAYAEGLRLSSEGQYGIVPLRERSSQSHFYVDTYMLLPRHLPAHAELCVPVYLLKGVGESFAFPEPGEYRVNAWLNEVLPGSMKERTVCSAPVVVKVAAPGAGWAAYRDVLHRAGHDEAAMRCWSTVFWHNIEEALAQDPARFGLYASALRRHLSTQLGGSTAWGAMGVRRSAWFGRRADWWRSVIDRGLACSEPGTIMKRFWWEMAAAQADRAAAVDSLAALPGTGLTGCPTQPYWR